MKELGQIFWIWIFDFVGEVDKVAEFSAQALWTLCSAIKH